MSVGLVLPLWENGPPIEATISLVIAGLLVKAREVHAGKPGVWFPLLVTGSTAFALALSGGLADGWELSIGSSTFGLWRFLIGLAVAIGLGFWAWRARSWTVAITASGYLTAVWYLQQVVTGPDGVHSLSAEEIRALEPSFDTQPYPELVIVAGAVLAYARLDRVRPWHGFAIAGLVGSLWHHGALTLVVVAVVFAAYDLNARRPGVWFPLLLTGIGLVAWPVLGWWTAPQWPDAGLEGLPEDHDGAVRLYVMSDAAVATSYVHYDELFPAFGIGPVVLAGAAVAFAAAAPGPTRTVGRSAGTPDRWPGP
ncbi:hypothetical protein ALI22I_31985 [Saccharothrix sp. ALI-22-I]|nr:hypothetical protein ALI22I_31985 [Saccharothrix sp. ALI-22-I]